MIFKNARKFQEAAAEKAAKINSKLTDSELVTNQLKETIGMYEEEIILAKKKDKELTKLKTKLEVSSLNLFFSFHPSEVQKIIQS